MYVSKPEIPQKPVSILCIGDSLTADGEWVCEFNRRLTAQDGEPVSDGFSNIKFIGTCEENKVFYEGYGGWRWESYLAVASGTIWVAAEGNDRTDDDQHSLWKDEAYNRLLSDKKTTAGKKELQFILYFLKKDEMFSVENRGYYTANAKTAEGLIKTAPIVSEG